jgi:hypothetical protein
VRTSGPVAGPTTPMSRSTPASRRATSPEPEPERGRATKRSRTRGASAATRVNRCRAEVLHEAFAGAQGEGAVELRDIEQGDRAQRRFGGVDEGADLGSQLQRARRGYQAAAGADQERVAGFGAQAGQGSAHGRRAEAQAHGGAGHAAFGEQGVEGEQEVQVGAGHAGQHTRNQTWRQMHV